MELINKPPLGLEPEWSWKIRIIRKRIIDIISAIYRYEESNIDVPNEWLDELDKLSNELINLYDEDLDW